VQLKAVLRVDPWISCATNVLVVIILTRSNQNYPSVTPMSQGGFWSHGAQEFWFPTLITILDPSWTLIFNIGIGMQRETLCSAPRLLHTHPSLESKNPRRIETVTTHCCVVQLILVTWYNSNSPTQWAINIQLNPNTVLNKHFTGILSFNPHNNSVGLVSLWF
jgi:hypothetical protein